MNARPVTLTLLSLLIALTLPAAPAPDYVVAVDAATLKDEGWRKVVEVLERKHDAARAVYEGSVNDLAPRLRKDHPRYVCFVSPPEKASRKFVSQVHELCRDLDQDPYLDVRWGILTGYDADNAYRIASHNQPLLVRNAASGTEIALDMVEQGQWYCELKKNRWVRKKSGGDIEELRGPEDTTAALAGLLTKDAADLFVTSGHATEREWMIGFRYRNGYFRCKDGRLYGEDTGRKRIPIESPNPKVYLPIGNCLMGHIDSRDAMALAFMNSGGVNQMIGYTVPTWYGYMGWGMLDYFVEQPGRFTLNESFMANHHALIHRMETFFPKLTTMKIAPGGRPRVRITTEEAAREAGLKPMDGMGLLFDRDVVAFYGDPAWQARMAKAQCRWDQTLDVEKNRYTFTIRPRAGSGTFQPVNTNGSQRGWRPVVHFLPHRVRDIRMLEGRELKPVVADDFILVPNPRTDKPAEEYRVVFEATPIR